LRTKTQEIKQIIGAISPITYLDDGLYLDCFIILSAVLFYAVLT